MTDSRLAEIILDKTNAGRSVCVAPGDSVLLRLDEIPTSGYRWEVRDCDPAVLQLASDDFVRSETAGLGGGGQREFRFDVVGPGQTELRLACRRSWEPESDAAEELIATIVAEAATD
jgi:inhibitor of cysteine peptidase